MSAFRPRLLPEHPVTDLDAYLATDAGGLGIARAQELGPAATRALVADAGLRGRGGGGFPTGRKWESVASQRGATRYVVVNGAEGEPGTFKDRAILRANPYQVVEGMLITALAVGASHVYVGLKQDFEVERELVTRAIADMQAAGICRDCAVTVVAGPDLYLYGEETALLEVIEGGEPLPRWFPPYQHGLFASVPASGWQGGGWPAGTAPRPGRAAPPPGTAPASGSNPTVVNNVETLANVPLVLAHGAEWFREVGTGESPGSMVMTVVGDVVAPDVGEVPLGMPLRQVIDLVGSGLPSGRSVKAVLSGVANPVFTAEHLDVPVAFETMAAVGSGMGAAGFIVLDDTACMVSAALVCSRFLSVESCGQCPPCKLGSMQITELLERLEAGAGTAEDLDEIERWLDHVTDGNRCYLAVEEQLVVGSILRAFRHEFEEHVELGGCPRARPLPMWKLLDLSGGVATYDERFWRKLPDWTYAPEG